MPPITTDRPRDIVDDFAKLIIQKRTQGSKPGKWVINFRDEKRRGHERDIWQVPVSSLRYRMDNGRIASDVQDHEKNFGVQDEKDQKTQDLLGKFLEGKDPDKTIELMKSIEHMGQSEPAIITCDGFLINGNRRKMALEGLKKKKPGAPEFEFMKVVILPGFGPQDANEGGLPTLLEIEQLENRYQLQSDGKAEYYGFDKALSIQRKIKVGYTLKMQLMDDSRYVGAKEKEIAQAVEKMEQDYLRPLACIDRYLRLFGREGLYAGISSGRGDREGRWEAFKDYSETYHRRFLSPNWRMDAGVEEDDIGGLEDAAFKIIKVRSLPNMPKVHEVMRRLPKLCANKESRKELLKLSSEVKAHVPDKDCDDDKGNRLSLDKIDEKWAHLNQRPVIHRLANALDLQEIDLEKETPLTLLEAALKKLNHEKMSVAIMNQFDLHGAHQLVSEIQKRAKEIDGEIYHYKKGLESLARKK